MSGEVEYYVTEDERSNTNNDEFSSSEKNENDVIENKIQPRSATTQDAPSPLSETPIETKNDESDANENRIRPRSATSRDVPSSLNESPMRTEDENDVTNDLESTKIASNGGADITVPGISENKNSEENSSPRGGKYNLRSNPNPNFSDEYIY